jgi:TonB family protein
VAAGHDPLTVPAQRPPAIAPSSTPIDVTPMPPQPDIQVQPMASGLATLPGITNSPPGPPTTSTGSGANGGAGTGDGGGIGPGKGDGRGPGYGRNFGDGVPGPGNGVTTPVLLREVKPAYTGDAMRAKVQGSVLVECIVNADGTVGDARVARSLDGVFGLDQEALKAAKQWRFRPGTFRGQPVPVRVTIELTFTLR